MPRFYVRARSTPKFQKQLERIAQLPRAGQQVVMDMLDGVLMDMLDGGDDRRRSSSVIRRSRKPSIREAIFPNRLKLDGFPSTARCAREAIPFFMALLPS